VPADRDSSPFSTEVVATFRNGRVDAGQGLDVRTVRPRLTLLTRVVTAPRHPVLEITFNKSGRVAEVRLLRSSGYRVEVDEPVLAAAYNWRAGGELIDRLPDHPSAGVKMTITIILN
jgi:TonB family protein